MFMSSWEPFTRKEIKMITKSVKRTIFFIITIIGNLAFLSASALYKPEEIRNTISVHEVSAETQQKTQQDERELLSAKDLLNIETSPPSQLESAQQIEDISGVDVDVTFESESAPETDTTHNGIPSLDEFAAQVRSEELLGLWAEGHFAYRVYFSSWGMFQIQITLLPMHPLKGAAVSLSTIILEEIDFTGFPNGLK